MSATITLSYDNKEAVFFAHQREREMLSMESEPLVEVNVPNSFVLDGFMNPLHGDLMEKRGRVAPWNHGLARATYPEHSPQPGEQ